MQCPARLPGMVQCELKPLEAREQIRERYAGLETRQRRSQAKVSAVTKSQVSIRIASDVEMGRIGKLARIAVRGSDHRQDQAAG